MPERHFKASKLLSVFCKSPCLPLLLLAGLFATSHTSANSATDNTRSSEKPANFAIQQSLELANQRKLFKQAEAAFSKRHFGKFRQLKKQLKNYPLYTYLEYKSLVHNLTRNRSSLSQPQVYAFLQENDDTVIGNRFRTKLIKHAARTANWQVLLDIYRPDYGVTMECHYLYALIKTGQSKLAYPGIENLWLSASSQPDTCNPAFKSWEAAGHKTPELIWQRFKLAISTSNRKLAGFLIRSMPARDAAIARNWLKVHRKPELITSPAVLNLKHPELPDILVHGLKRLSYRDIDAAISAYHQLKTYPFTPQQIATMNRHIGLKLAREHMPDAALWLARVPASHANKVVKEWRIRTAIRQGDWSFVLSGISQLDIDEKSDYRWQYWWAYANEQLGNTNDALGIYQYLANKRSYYGFLAADHLNLDYAFEDKPVEPSDEIMNALMQKPEALRAREFYLLGKLLPARREWHRLIKISNTEEKLAASKLAQSWNWHDRAIVTMGQTRYRDDIELRFPMHLNSKVYAWSSRRNIDPAWTYAIIRRESAFMHDARSSVGALGLMQLMPNTARFVARQLKVRYGGRRSLLSSNTNIRLGTGYLERMLGKLNNQHVLATAAYNAGPHRVEKWLPEQQKMDAIRWIETIPFTETREYVSNVLAYMVIYEHRMQRKITRLSQRMPLVPAKNPVPTTPVDSVKQTAQNPGSPQNGSS